MGYPSGIRSLLAIGLLVGAVALTGCPKRPEVTQATPGTVGPTAAAMPATPAPATPSPTTGETPVTRPAAPGETPATPAPAPAAAAAAVPGASPLKDVFFDYDKAALRDDQKAALSENIGWLKGNAGAKALIEGHCDERGTAEYNLGLGERRAKTVKDYLIAAGIAADRISTISYGKERPFVLGHDESAWKWNRRSHFVIQGK
jgi:peptidoglycan-associated lipoprotein